MNKETQFRKPNNNSSFIGLIIIFFGILLLINNIIPNIYFFNRLFSWPLILIGIGLVIGHKSHYENTSSYVLIIIGVFFLILRLFDINFNMLFWPIILVAVGFSLIAGRTKRNRFRPRPTPPTQAPIWDKRVYSENDLSSGVYDNTSSQPSINEEFKDENQPNMDATDANNQQYFNAKGESNQEQNYSKQTYSGQDYTKQDSEQQEFARDEYVDSTSVFSSNKINVVSRKFKGGNLVNIFAGTEINLMRADMAEPAVLEVVQLFGGSTIIAPAHWVIQPEMASFFGGIEDKRFINSMPDSSKVLYIRGTSLFGGITIKSM